MVETGLNIKQLSTTHQHLIHKTYSSTRFIQIRNKFRPTSLFLLNAILHEKVQSLFLPSCQFCRVLNQNNDSMRLGTRQPHTHRCSSLCFETQMALIIFWRNKKKKQKNQMSIFLSEINKKLCRMQVAGKYGTTFNILWPNPCVNHGLLAISKETLVFFHLGTKTKHYFFCILGKGVRSFSYCFLFLFFWTKWISCRLLGNE